MKKYFAARLKSFNLKRFRLKSATKLALFSAGCIMTAVFILYSLLFFTFLAETGSGGNRPDYPFFILLLSLLFIAPLSYFTSSLIIDKALNPVRTMIEKVRSVGERDFGSKISVDSSEDELREYALAFNQMSSKLDEYIEKQKRFISDASHELVTPVTVIAGHADMLLRWGKDDAHMLADGLDTIKKEAFAMNSLIEDLLFFARSDSDRMAYTKQTIDFTRLLSECIAEQRVIRPDFPILFDTTKPHTIHADPEAMKRVIRILFANSVKYSRDSKQITVTLYRKQRLEPALLTTRREEAKPQENRQALILRVSDCGIGIAPDRLPKIFDRFYRIDDSRAKETGGTGLGLAIAKKILNAHGYAITAESVPEEGTTMVIELFSL